MDGWMDGWKEGRKEGWCLATLLTDQPTNRPTNEAASSSSSSTAAMPLRRSHSGFGIGGRCISPVLPAYLHNFPLHAHTYIHETRAQVLIRVCAWVDECDLPIPTWIASGREVRVGWGFRCSVFLSHSCFHFWFHHQLTTMAVLRICVCSNSVTSSWPGRWVCT